MTRRHNGARSAIQIRTFEPKQNADSRTGSPYILRVVDTAARVSGEQIVMYKVRSKRLCATCMSERVSLSSVDYFQWLTFGSDMVHQEFDEVLRTLDKVASVGATQFDLTHRESS
jgi:hypothetical protein